MDPRAVLKAILTSLKQGFPAFTYRLFMATVHRGVINLVESNGSPAYRCVNAGVSNVAIVTCQSPKGKELLNRLGYVDFPNIPGSMIMEDYEASLPFLKAFSQLSEEELVLTKGDPAALALPQTADRATLVFHLGYHFHIRFQMLCFTTDSTVVHVIEKSMQDSAAAVDQIASRLNIMTPGSPARVAWDSSKATAMDYVRSRGSLGDPARHEIGRALNNTSHHIRVELTFRVSSSVAHLISYLQNVQAVVGNTWCGGMLSRDGLGIYLNTAMEMTRGCFSEEYMQGYDAVQHLMMVAVERPLTDVEVDKVHMMCLWQADNMVTHFQPACFQWEVGMGSAFEQAGLGDDVYTSLRALGLEEYSSMLETQAVAPPCNPDTNVGDSFRLDGSDDDEKEDKTEKQDKPEKDDMDKIVEVPATSIHDVGDSSGDQTGHITFTLDALEARLSQAEDVESIHSVLSEITILEKESEDQSRTLRKELEDLLSSRTSDEPEIVAMSLDAAVHDNCVAVKAVSLAFETLRRLKDVANQKLTSKTRRRLYLRDLSGELLHHLLCKQPDMDGENLTHLTRAVVDMMPVDMLVALGNQLRLNRELIGGDRMALCCRIRARMA